MAWQHRVGSWVDAWAERHPSIDHWLEAHFHAVGLHGPQVWHLLAVRFVPAVTVLAAGIMLTIVLALIRGRNRGRHRRRGARARAA